MNVPRVEDIQRALADIIDSKVELSGVVLVVVRPNGVTSIAWNLTPVEVARHCYAATVAGIRTMSDGGEN